MTKDLPRRPKCCIISVTSIGEASCVPMKRQLLAAALVLILIVYPSLGITEDVETVMLAKTLYTLCRDESYDTMLAMGTVVMNRVDSPFFPDNIEDVLNQPHQFARGNRYDERSLQAAREIRMGKRTLPSYVLYYHEVGTDADWSTRELYVVWGKYGFYNAEGL